MIREACVGNINEAIRAEALGADRIELCENLGVGGTTPSAGTIQLAKQHLQIPIMVLIRPRGGDFVYSSVETEVMKKDIELCKAFGVHGVVIGALNADHTIDIELTSELVRLAQPLKITFHKAMDETNSILREFEKLCELGIHRVLTSGGKGTALEGLEIINEMIRISNNRMKILAAGKITSSNLSEHHQLIRTDEFHGKLIVGNLS